ncbi:zinc finger protein VAR3, chloroplastic [Ricinus communis]|uniref:zinc finger protein VAR3, chloroplastic n=1 Tax=Ricinus communis TaxID=3988 RepID=UPI00201AC6C9|nr:zinc finger protein VAR3, chloroplastic [Ricinus communis]
MGGATRFLMLLTTTTATAPSPFLLHHYHHRIPSLLRLSRHRRQLLHSLSHYHHNSSLCLPGPLKIKASQQQQQQLHTQTASLTRAAGWPVHPWAEWSNFINNLSISGYFNRQIEIDEDDELIITDGVNLPEHFICAVNACSAFSREKPHLLRMLSRRDIEVVVDKGMPFLFKNGDVSKRRMMSFLGIPGANVQNTDKAHTIDLVRFLLSYASNLVSSKKNNLPSEEIESSVRYLLGELAQLSYTPQTNLSVSVQNQFPDRYEQASRPLGQNIEMKRGDWICPRCSFMNFARNMKCLECEEARPKRQLTGGEWECPQCDFFNYGRNMACLRCDCKRPGHVSLGTTNSRSGLGYGNGSDANRDDVDSRLAANEEKAQRWFSKISQMDSNSDMGSAIADEDFPEIMPLRKGVNRFVVSTRKTPLERRLANAEYERTSRNSSPVESTGANTSASQPISQRLDAILGRKTAGFQSDDKTFNIGQNMESNTPSSTSNYIPFVPLPADMFAKKLDKTQMDKSEAEMDSKSLASSTGEKTASGSDGYSKSSENWQPSENPMGRDLSNEKEREQAEKSERWFKRVAELHNVKDLASEISDEDFPEIMPMRKGENRFVVSKRKDRSLTSPMYKRRMAMEQASDTNFVPFVPFPPNYFAQKDNQQSGGADSANNARSAISNSNSNSTATEELSEKLDDSKPGPPAAAYVQGMENQQDSTGSTQSRAWKNSNESKADATYEALTSGKSTQDIVDTLPNRRNSWTSGYSRNEIVSGKSNLMDSSIQNYTTSPTSGKESRNSGFSSEENVKEVASLTEAISHPSKNQDIRENWNGKSLEGSAVKEPDPLDMSEEAKAERWFRRVAQIKDISELSQIPDEDFPSIMPMRKGVNRFVVSKRKTPLERRLTSTQYRKSLPTVNSDPVKKSDSS